MTGVRTHAGSFFFSAIFYFFALCSFGSLVLSVSVEPLVEIGCTII